MSQLIRMRQRIKAIRTIKKITHALRLISMSGHLRLRSKKNGIEEYRQQIASIFLPLYAKQPDWKHPLLSAKRINASQLAILIGSQKGLCGNFNTQGFAFFEKSIKNKEQLDLITIGKKAHEYARHTNNKIIQHYDVFSITNADTICREVTEYIIKTAGSYSQVMVYSTFSKSFFVQKPQAIQLIPFEVKNTETAKALDEYVWEQSPYDLLPYLIEQMVYITLYDLMFQSLIAEQAARFIAMDNSTRSAGKLLDSMRLTYNKMRQSKITAELTDLVGGFF